MTLPADSWDKVRSEFQRLWGYKDFRPPQGEVIANLLAQRDALVVLPTGGGKSICFQLPALLQTGLTLVVSPLIALIENQVDELRRRQLPAAQFHSELPAQHRQQTLWALEHSRLRLLYLSPESLLSEAIWQRLMQPKLKINGLILDEAHCLVQWGETFRPAYRRLGAVRPAFLKAKPAGSQIAIAAFTATADPQTQQTIQRVLQLEQPAVFRLSPYRPNLKIQIRTVWTPRGRRQQLLQFIQTQPGTGLIYTRSRRDTEALTTGLAAQGYPTAAYHAGLGPTERRRIEAAWLQGELRFVVCTCAFGMGIDKANCRWVFHFHAPALLSEYVQEIGRAGRDGKPAQAVMLISEPTGWLDPEDKQRQQFFQNQERQQQQLAHQLIHQIPVQGEVKVIVRQFKHAAMALSLLHSVGQLKWLDPFHYVINRSATPQALAQEKAIQKMAQYLHAKSCRWQFILEAFGFAQDADALKEGCGHCDRCLSR